MSSALIISCVLFFTGAVSFYQALFHWDWVRTHSWGSPRWGGRRNWGFPATRTSCLFGCICLTLLGFGVLVAELGWMSDSVRAWFKERSRTILLFVFIAMAICAARDYFIHVHGKNR